MKNGGEFFCLFKNGFLTCRDAGLGGGKKSNFGSKKKFPSKLLKIVSSSIQATLAKKK